MRLTTNFWLREFECNDGSKMPVPVFRQIEVLANQLQRIRNDLNVPIKITNAYRSPAHNKAVGGVRTSQHLLGKACDIQVKDISPMIVYNTIERLIGEGVIKEGGLGLYNTFVHYDIRDYKARWNYSSINRNDK